MLTPPRSPCYMDTSPRSRAASATQDVYHLENAQQVTGWSSPVTMRFIQASQDVNPGEAFTQKMNASPCKNADVQAALVRVMSRNAIHEPGTKPGIFNGQVSPRAGVSPRAQRASSLEPRQGAATVPFPPASPDRMQHHLASATASNTPRLQGATAASTPRIQGSGTPGFPSPGKRQFHPGVVQM